MTKIQILKILVNREKYLIDKQKELNENQSKDLDYNQKMQQISYSLNEVSLLSQIIYLTWDITEEK